MASENVAAVRGFVDAFNRLDIESVLDDLDPAVELHEWPEAPGAQSYHGHQGVRQALDAWFETWQWMRVEIMDIVEVGDRVLFTLHQRAKGKGSEAEVEIKSFNVYTFSDSKLVRLELFTEEDAALRAAGLDRNEGQEVRWLRQVNEAIARGDVTAFSEALHPDVVWEHNIGVGSPEEGVYRGRQSVISLFERILEPWEHMRPVPQEIRELGEGRYLVEGELQAKHRTSQAEVVTHYEQTLEVRDGLLVSGAMKTGNVVPDRSPAG